MMKAIRSPRPKLGSDICHNVIYTSQDNFKSSSTTRKLQHAAILSCWHNFCMLRLSKNSYNDDSAHKLWRMIAWWKRCYPYTLLLDYIKNICWEDSIIHQWRLSVLTEYLFWIHSHWDFWLDMLFWTTPLTFLLPLIGCLWHPQAFAIKGGCPRDRKMNMIVCI